MTVSLRTTTIGRTSKIKTEDKWNHATIAWFSLYNNKLYANCVELIVV